MGASPTRPEYDADLTEKSGCASLESLSTRAQFDDLVLLSKGGAGEVKQVFSTTIIFKAFVSKEQLNNLYRRFQQLSGNKETISREDLECISALDDNPIRKEIISAFFDKRNQHQNEVGCFDEINFEQFLMVMSHFRPVSSSATEDERKAVRRQKLRFLFNMHDTDNDGKITLDEYRTVVEELLSKSGTIATEVVASIADAAMLEVASTNVPDMGPDEFYEGITFEHFEQILKDLEMESKMHIRFLDVNTATMHCGKLTP